MAVVFVTTLTVKPDRFEEYLEENARKAKALVAKHGGRNCRLLAALVAGEQTEASHSLRRQMISPLPVLCWTSSWPILKRWP